MASHAEKWAAELRYYYRKIRIIRLIVIGAIAIGISALYVMYLGAIGAIDATASIAVGSGLTAALVALLGVYVLYRATSGFYGSREFLAAAVKIDRAVEDVAGPNDLLKLMEVNRRQMEAYDVQARSQGRSSHRSSLFAMTAGLAIVGAGLWITVNADDSATKYAAAIVAAVGTATGGYIARTFIRVNTAAQQHVRYYFEQPLVQSYLLTAERVAERLPNRKREHQYELIVAAALQQAGMVSQLRDTSDEAEAEPDPVEEEPSADEGEGSDQAEEQGSEHADNK
ncbi:hypothetical protein ACFV24_05735 [Nocardia fluminea]|uniref:TRADD-N-associated membrane domain-containing protein n=1 Tax=Nocardia fluminea TaxID=134984 RepID=UPI00366C0E61